MLSRIKDDANVEVTHFVLEGTASVIQRLVLERYRRKIDGKWGYRLHNDQSAKVSLTHSNLKIIFMQICKLNEGACFGLGEKLAKKMIIAHTELKCLVVPKSIILRNKTPYNIWERIIITLDLNTPSLQQVYKEYMNARRKLAWATDVYKCGQYGVYNRIPVNVTIHDVPLTIRSSSVQYANKCKAAMKDPMYLVGEKKTQKNDRRLNINLA
ncbi:uncharacterized protein isoform X2 [Rhodnius prolixus]|uniref:uncharacterized protein isoform X2 n=1 Tax=Rhodnius prolixus TaxID=13249 RepID=UPI003D18C902